MKLRVPDQAKLRLLITFLSERGCIVAVDPSSPTDTVIARARDRDDEEYVAVLVEEWRRRTPGAALDVDPPPPVGARDDDGASAGR